MINVKKILEARQLKEAHHFDREVVARVPYSVYDDELTLKCGHTVVTCAGFMERETHICFDCINAFMKGAE